MLYSGRCNEILYFPNYFERLCRNIPKSDYVHLPKNPLFWQIVRKPQNILNLFLFGLSYKDIIIYFLCKLYKSNKWARERNIKEIRLSKRRNQILKKNIKRNAGKKSEKRVYIIIESNRKKTETFIWLIQ